MTITEYFNNYKTNSKFPFSLRSGDDKTIQDFYDHFIFDFYKSHAIISNMIAWHDMLVEYTKDDKNIFWVRKYETGLDGKNANRRASRVDFLDQFKIVYVSNYDVHEIFNMAIIGVKPDLEEFKRLMNDKKGYPFHYKNTKTCEEFFTHWYNTKKEFSVNGGVLTKASMYLAHIRSVNENPYFVGGKTYYITKKNNETFHDKLFPYGKVANWTSSSDRIFVQTYSLANDEKQIIKSHFLRFVDPLNYFPVPGDKHQIYSFNQDSNHYYNVGEFPLLISFIYEKFKELFKSVNFDDFDKLTSFDNRVLPKNDPNTEINIAYRIPKRYLALSKKNVNDPLFRKTISTTKVSTKVNRDIQTHRKSKRVIIFSLIKTYISDSKISSLSELNVKFPNIGSLTKDITDSKRFHSEAITMPNGDLIRISNQIGDKPGFRSDRNYSKLTEKLEVLTKKTN